MTRAEALAEAASWLDRRAAHEANGSRDFGRGYKHAVRLLAEKADRERRKEE